MRACVRVRVHLSVRVRVILGLTARNLQVVNRPLSRKRHCNPGRVWGL